MSKIIVIGAGFGGMSAAAYLAQEGHNVTVIEKTAMPGGRAQVFSSKGFTFDAGPSWYMMPDVFDDFFASFGKKTSDYYKLKKLDPAYQVISNSKKYTVPTYPKVLDFIKSVDENAIKKFDEFYKQSEKNYKNVRKGILDLPMTKTSHVLRPDVLKFLLSKNMYKSYARRIENITKDDDLQHIFQFMSVFMGGSPKDIPAVYSLLAYVDLGLGVYYPEGGFGSVARGFEKLCMELGVKFKYSEPVEKIETTSSIVKRVVTTNSKYDADIVIANADYQYVETKMLETENRSYNDKYWEKSDVSPSGLVMLLGIDKKLKNLLHHSLFFDTEWDKHFKLLKQSKWSEEPLFYLSAPSISDSSIAPKGTENLFVLAPQAAGIKPTKKQLENTEKNIIKRLSKQTGTDISKHVITKQSLTSEYFIDRFNSYKGNAFGMSHTLTQSAIFRPRVQSKKVKDLYYVGQYTNPGTGVPMVVLSGKVVASLVESNNR